MGRLLLLLVLSPAAGACELWVFVARAAEVQPGTVPCQVVVLNFDRLSSALHDWNAALPADPQPAQAYLRTHQARLEKRLRQAYEPVQWAAHFQITELPAVVVNQQVVVTGSADLERVYETYQASRR